MFHRVGGFGFDILMANPPVEYPHFLENRPPDNTYVHEHSQVAQIVYPSLAICRKRWEMLVLICQQ